MPRRRTEFLVRQAAAVLLLAAGPEVPTLTPPPAVVVDLCCGSGAVGAALATALDEVELHAVDIDPAAVPCARRNLTAAGPRVYEGDLDGPAAGCVVRPRRRAGRRTQGDRSGPELARAARPASGGDERAPGVAHRRSVPCQWTGPAGGLLRRAERHRCHRDGAGDPSLEPRPPEAGLGRRAGCRELSRGAAAPPPRTGRSRGRRTPPWLRARAPGRRGGHHRRGCPPSRRVAAVRGARADAVGLVQG